MILPPLSKQAQERESIETQLADEHRWVGEPSKRAPSRASLDEQVAPKLLTVRQLSQYLGISEGSLRNQASPEFSGCRVPGRLKMGNRIYYDKKRVDAHIARKVLDAERQSSTV